jgi:hypothetical protein
MQSRRSFLKTLATGAVALGAGVASIKLGQRVAETPAPVAEPRYDYRTHYFISKDGTAMQSAQDFAEKHRDVQTAMRQADEQTENMKRQHAEMLEGLRKQNEA